MNPDRRPAISPIPTPTSPPPPKPMPDLGPYDFCSEHDYYGPSGEPCPACVFDAGPW